MHIKGIAITLLVGLLILPPTYGESSQRSSLCQSSEYSCIRIKRGESWQSLFPDEREREIVMRINRTNGRLHPGMVIQIPQDLDSSDVMDYAPFPRQIDPPNEKLIIIDPNKHAWGAYDPEGALVRWGPATGGAGWCRDIGRSCRTKSGAFRIYSLGSSNCVSSKFPVPDGGAPMPYCMFFNGGQALHGSPGGVVRDNASHGCVRLYVSDAEWLRYDFVEGPNAYNGYRGTKVIVRPY